MSLKIKHNNLIDKTIKSYLNHLKLKYKKGFVFKNDLALFETENKIELLAFLRGFSINYDTKMVIV